MPSETPPNPTGRELDIMRVLWKRGPGNVREVLDDLNQQRPKPFAYTTILRFFQIMTGISVLVLLVSCEREKPTPRTPEKQDQPKGVLYLERLLDAEAVMAELGNLAWVYKIRGDGELTTEYTTKGKERERVNS